MGFANDFWYRILQVGWKGKIVHKENGLVLFYDNRANNQINLSDQTTRN